jgi:hypothetical protein
MMLTIEQTPYVVKRFNKWPTPFRQKTYHYENIYVFYLRINFKF